MTVGAVVDTNVLVVANGRETHVDVSCQLRCVDELARLSREECGVCRRQGAHHARVREEVRTPGAGLIHGGKVYGRSVAAEAANKWMAMVKKHHAWKVTEPDVYLYGEDIYGVHSIEYGAVREIATFHAFALRDSNGDFRSMAALEQFAAERSIPVVPVLHRGIFASVRQIAQFIREEHVKPSVLGGEREGMVIRASDAFPSSEFSNNVCKSVRQDHVQTDQHWTRSWRPCALSPD